MHVIGTSYKCRSLAHVCSAPFQDEHAVACTAAGFSAQLVRTHYEPCAVLQPPPAAAVATSTSTAATAGGSSKRVPSAKAGDKGKPGKAVAAAAASGERTGMLRQAG
jgi:hypothetical protein